jgi:N-acetylglutamate synthase-like GNAT family acetyltransferase
MSEPLIVIDSPTREDIAYLEQRLDEYNLSHTGITDARLLMIVLRDDSGDIIAGLHGWTWGGCCEVKTLWVHERMRGTGLGTRLMKAAESEARARGATQIVLSTHSFQAPAFYARLGFAEFARVDACPAGHNSIYLKKALRDA